LASALPKAPSLKIFCLYGVGQPTERAYRYSFRNARWAWGDSELLPEGGLLRWSSSKSVEATVEELRGHVGAADEGRPVRIDAVGHSLAFPNVIAAIEWLQGLVGGTENLSRWIRINTDHRSDPAGDPWDNGARDGVFANGVAHSDGDSTVPLLSLGYMCSHGWREFPEFNPAGVKVYTKELLHEPTAVYRDPRGGPATAKHLDIIGNHEVIADILRVAAGTTSHLESDQFYSNISALGRVVSERVRKAFAR